MILPPWYTLFNQAIQIVLTCGTGALMVKCEIQSAFHLLPVHPEDFCFLGFKFSDCWYAGKAMLISCPVACATFKTFSTFIEWVVKDCPHLTHYLDDFLLRDPAGSSACADCLDISQALEVPLAQDKTEGPTTWLTYLDIQLDLLQSWQGIKPSFYTGFPCSPSRVCWWEAHSGCV